MEVPGWRAAGWRKVDWRGLDGGKWLDGGMDGVKMRLGLRGSMSCVVSRGSRFLRFTGVDGSWRFGSGLRFGSRPSWKIEGNHIFGRQKLEQCICRKFPETQQKYASRDCWGGSGLEQQAFRLRAATPRIGVCSQVCRGRRPKRKPTSCLRVASLRSSIRSGLACGISLRGFRAIWTAQRRRQRCKLCKKHVLWTCIF